MVSVTVDTVEDTGKLGDAVGVMAEEVKKVTDDVTVTGGTNVVVLDETWVRVEDATGDGVKVTGELKMSVDVNATLEVGVTDTDVLDTLTLVINDIDTDCVTDDVPITVKVELGDFKVKLGGRKLVL